LAKEVSESVYLSHLSEISEDPLTSEQILQLGIEETKNLLMKALDKNALYVNISELEEMTTGLTKDDIRVTEMFYSKGK
jgi:hypothetical protein